MTIFSDNRYESLFKSAQVETNNANLSHEQMVINHNKKINQEKLDYILELSMFVINKQLNMYLTNEIYRKDGYVNYFIHNELNKRGIKNEITIGNIVDRGERKINNLSYESLSR